MSSLGIGIGVASLIAMLSISEGARVSTLQAIESLGIYSLRIERNSFNDSEQNGLTNLSRGLTLKDRQFLRGWFDGGGLVTGYRKIDESRARYLTSKTKTMAVGVDAVWFQVEQLAIAEGRKLLAIDVRKKSRNCVLGADTARLLQAQLGSVIQVENQLCTVVGIARSKGKLMTEGTGLSSLDFDNAVYLPISTLPLRRPIGEIPSVDGIVIKLFRSQGRSLVDTAGQVEEILLRRHRGIKDFQIIVPESLLKEAKASQIIFSFIMGSIAGLSLLVGGIGVLNVMLANIAEQTREIALRLAIGGTPRRILYLYLCHSVLLSFFGSIWGVVAGILFAIGIQQYAEWDVAFSEISILIAPMAAIITGVVFGLYPAIRAAGLEPALALREH